MPWQDGVMQPNHGAIYSQGVVATPSDATNEVDPGGNGKQQAYNGLWLSSAFTNLKFTGLNGLVMTFESLPAGWHFCGRVERVWLNGTDAFSGTKKVYLVV